MQSKEFCSICTFKEEYCRNPPFEFTRYKFLNKELEYITSNVGNTYEDGRNCIVSITAKPNHQIEVQLLNLQIDQYADIDTVTGMPRYCNDYIKLFNGNSDHYIADII